MAKKFLKKLREFIDDEAEVSGEEGEEEVEEEEEQEEEAMEEVTDESNLRQDLALLLKEELMEEDEKKLDELVSAFIPKKNQNKKLNKEKHHKEKLQKEELPKEEPPKEEPPKEEPQKEEPPKEEPPKEEPPKEELPKKELPKEEPPKDKLSNVFLQKKRDPKSLLFDLVEKKKTNFVKTLDGKKIPEPFLKLKKQMRQIIFIDGVPQLAFKSKNNQGFVTLDGKTAKEKKKEAEEEKMEELKQNGIKTTKKGKLFNLNACSFFLTYPRCPFKHISEFVQSFKQMLLYKKIEQEDIQFLQVARELHKQVILTEKELETLVQSELTNEELQEKLRHIEAEQKKGETLNYIYDTEKMGFLNNRPVTIDDAWKRTRIHYHVLLILKQKKSIKNPNYFDLSKEEDNKNLNFTPLTNLKTFGKISPPNYVYSTPIKEPVHGNYAAAHDNELSYMYCLKTWTEFYTTNTTLCKETLEEIKNHFFYSEGTFISNDKTKQTLQKRKNEIMLNVPLNKLVEEGIVSIHEVPLIKKTKDILMNEKLETYAQNNKLIERKCYWIGGEAGSGKTYFVYNNLFKKESDNNNFYAKTFSSWWDGYKGEEAVLVDEIFSEKKNEMLYYLKLWGDKLTVKQPIKGSFVNLVYKKIALTANFWPWELEMNSIEKKEFLDPILRRYKFIKLINYVPYEIPIPQEFSLNTETFVTNIYNQKFTNEKLNVSLLKLQREFILENETSKFLITNVSVCIKDTITLQYENIGAYFKTEEYLSKIKNHPELKDTDKFNKKILPGGKFSVTYDIFTGLDELGNNILDYDTNFLYDWNRKKTITFEQKRLNEQEMFKSSRQVASVKKSTVLLSQPEQENEETYNKLVNDFLNKLD